MTTQTEVVQDISARLQSLLVPWFGDVKPNVDAYIEGGPGTALGQSYIFYAYAILQTRIKTATGEFLDLIAQDFFGPYLQRQTNEPDSSFRNRILASLLQQMVTRPGMTRILQNLTGRTPILIDGDNTDACMYFDNTFYYDVGFGFGGIWPFQGLIIAYLPQPMGLYAINGYDNFFGYDFNAGNVFYDPAQEIIIVTPEQFLSTVELIKAYGTKIYTKFPEIPEPP